MGFIWHPNPIPEFQDLFDKHARATFLTGRRVGQRKAKEMEDWAKLNAPWKDRTKKAREGLHTTYEEAGPLMIITLQHGVYYGLYLEVKFGGRDAIISRAVAHFGPRLMRDLQAIINLGHITVGD